ncbi:tyrosine-protein phosphatase YwqE [Flavobacterium arsenatis]|uniref:protein-tyrosine-phosphatase n=1 Tax=Flavobacterium arsenatis TaxID=1484332 RepID=A0ABU1TLB1_9FLAO|nr:CpsB/CapC family capsule biosynthesis tyrosine phosphatase [Flavobacterium arsenatis]MDR6966188.1 tyrosine-protein phosphatase YwqE [Flavobacterium arsenatis]
MFFFNRNKTVLKDLIPDNHIDFHSHLLFGIDDGAKTFEDTLSLTKSMLDFGVKEFITTPHIIQHVWENNTGIITTKKDEVVSLLKENNINLPFKAAAEYLMDDHFVKLFQSEPLLTLKDNYVLVEMSYINAPIQLYDIIFDLQVAGYKPVLAHPERYVFYHKNFSEYTKLKKAGCLFQLNMLSTVGYYGESVFVTAKKLLESGMIDYVGSDVHHKKHIEAFSNKLDIKDLNPLKEVISNNQFFTAAK